MDLDDLRLFVPLKTIVSHLYPGLEIEVLDSGSFEVTTEILFVGHHHNWLTTSGLRLCGGTPIKLTGRQHTLSLEMVSDLAIQKANNLKSYGWELPDWAVKGSK